MRIALGIEYDGSNYNGWQRQQKVNSIQQELEKALSIVADEKVEVFCAGRTDAGVHGTAQVVHFDTEKIRRDAAWTLGVNTQLPKDISVKWVQSVSDDFHARFSATARQYRYIIFNSNLRPAILAKGLSYFYHPLNAELMHEAAQLLIGEHDFHSFRTVHCQSKTSIRNLMHCNVSRQGDYVIIDIKANAFLHHMVRNITGSLLKVGQEIEPVSWIKEVLDARNRCLAGITAPSGGLYFVGVDYPERFGIPKLSKGPLFLP